MTPIAPSSVLHLLRITIEAASPLSLGGGDMIPVTRQRRRDGDDETWRGMIAALARDANGLPAIPGASLQGVLRHLHHVEGRETGGDPNATDALFGHAVGDAGQAARLAVGFGGVHDSRDVAAAGLLDPMADPLHAALVLTETPVLRDHVALNDRHVADGRRKFARAAVPAGTRFSFEIALWGREAERAADRATLRAVLSLLHHPSFRIGGATRRGYGRILVVRASYATPALGDPARLRALRAEPASTPLAKPGQEGDWTKTTAPEAAGAAYATVTLRPLQHWRIGGGDTMLAADTAGLRRGPDGAAAMPRGPSGNHGVVAKTDRLGVATIVREPRIAWRQGGGRWLAATADRPLAETGRTPAGEALGFPVPGSALRGPLAHRALFHWNRLQPAGGGMIDVAAFLALPPERRAERLKEFAGLSERRELGLFLGVPKARKAPGKPDADPDGAAEARASRLLVDDGRVVDVRAVQAIDHNSIDRFSGGVRDGALYAEEALAGGTITFDLTILPPLVPESDSRTPDPRTPDSRTPTPGTPDPGAAARDADIRTAFCRALRDLCEGRLAIGAKSLGYCDGKVVWHGAAARAWQETWDATARRDAAE